jgi:hypothetical protein
MKKESQVVTLPTDKVSSILINTYINETHSTSKFVQGVAKETLDQIPVEAVELRGYKYQHLYITTDEEIKEGDWCILMGDYGNPMSTPQQWLGKGVLNNGLRKIIATTDRSLRTKKISDDVICRKCSHLQAGSAQPSCPQCDYPTPHLEIETIYLPQPSQAFIEKYCEVGGIDKVMVEYYRPKSYSPPLPPLEPKVNSHNEITIHPIKDSWTREEVEELLIKCIAACKSSNGDLRKTNQEQDIDWIFKNL